MSTSGRFQWASYLFVAVLGSLTMSIQGYGQQIIYVDDVAAVGGDGMGWGTAFAELYDALDLAQSSPGVSEIRIAQGEYTPDRGQRLRTDTFELVNGITIRGGFAGAVSKTPDDRDVEAYPTILSGDILGDDGPDFAGYEDNSYHVLTAMSLDETVTLDGLMIGAGNANGIESHAKGGALYGIAANVSFVECVIDAHLATDAGAVYMIDGIGSYTACRLTNNHVVDKNGGAVFHVGAPLTFETCNISGNFADDSGAAMFVESSIVSLVNCTINNNTCEGLGGCVTVNTSTLTMTACELSGNYGRTVRVDALTPATITECNFASNTQGSAFQGGSVLLVINCTFLENEGDSSGGAITGGATQFKIVDCRFERNKADNKGGAILSYNTDFHVEQCEFIDNQAGHSDNGGAIEFGGGSTVIRNCTFEGNRAQNGSAISTKLFTGSDNAVLIEQCEFVANENVNPAGATVYLQGNGAPYVFRDCEVRDGTARGMLCTGPNVLIESSLFDGNLKGGIELNSAYTEAPNEVLVKDCTLRDNLAERGAGFYVIESSGTILNCVVETNQSDQFDGGGAWVEHCEDLAFVNCSFLGNQAVQFGGGVHVEISTVSLENCQVAGNVAAAHVGIGAGGGVFTREGITDIVNCTIFGNHALQGQGGGVASSAVETSLEAPSLTRVVNSIVWNNTALGKDDEIAQLFAGDIGMIENDFSCVQGWTGQLGGVGNIGDDPMLVNPPGADGVLGTADDDLHVIDGSPCVNAGVVGFTPIGLSDVDLDGQDRVQNCRIDMGADESPWALSLDCNDNGIQDECDTLDGFSSDCNENSVPDECDVAILDCNGNRIPDDCEVDCNMNGIPDTCDIASERSDDCNGNGIPDECDVISHIDVSSGELSPFVTEHPQSFALIDPVETLSDVQLNFLACAALEAHWQYVQVDVNGEFVGTIYEVDGSMCGLVPNPDEIIVPGDVFNAALLNDDSIVINMIPSRGIDLLKGADTYISVSVEYVGASPLDVNKSGIPDVCEHDADFDGDGTVGSSDLAILLGFWGVKSPAFGDLNFDGIVGPRDLAILLGLWGPVR